MNPIDVNDVLVNIIFALILVAGFGFILLIFKQTLSKWDVRIAIDDGLSIHYVKARMKGKTKAKIETNANTKKSKDKTNTKTENNKEINCYVLEYKDPDTKRIVEVLVPDQPGYLRFMRFWAGLRKYVVFRVDKSGQPLPWETGVAAIPVEKLEYLKTHETIINALRTRILLSKYMLYVIILVAIILVFTGIVTWRALERPIIVQIMQNTTTTTPMTYPNISPPPS